MINNINDIFKKNFHIPIIALILLLINNSIIVFYIDFFLYIVLHIFFVHLSFYNEDKINYFIVFLISFFLDLILLNNFGPHLISFMFIFFIINKIKKFFINKKVTQLILVQILLIIVMLVSEKILSFLLYDIFINLHDLLIMIIILVVVYYPIELLISLNK